MENTCTESILIVDDSPFVRAVLRGMLEDIGYSSIAVAGNRLEAMRLIRDHLPDIVLLDIILPDANGIDILESIHQISPDISVIICSSIGQEKTMRKALQHGAVAYLHKPATKQTLAEALSNIPKN